MIKKIAFTLTLILGFPGLAQGPPCDEDIILVNDAGCSTPCCFQEPPNSGHYVFRHETVEKIDIRGNSAAVKSLSFPNLTNVEKFIRISFNDSDAISRISFPALQSAGSLEITNNPGLTQVDLPRLMVIENDESDGYLKIQSNINLVAVNAPVLQAIEASEAGNAYLQIRYNPALEAIDFPHLNALAAGEDFGEAYIFIQGNQAAESVSMDRLRYLSAGVESISYLIIDEMFNLQRLSFPQLKELLPAGGPSDFSELTVGHSPNLTEFVFPALERVTLLQLSGLKGTRKAMFPKLAELDYLWVFRSCDNPNSTLKMYICSEGPLVDVLFNNDDGLCGENGYMLYSANPSLLAECDARDVCSTFIPDVTDCKCGSPGLCTTAQ